jgi:hypothetical protein
VSGSGCRKGEVRCFPAATGTASTKRLGHPDLGLCPDLGPSRYPVLNVIATARHAWTRHRVTAVAAIRLSASFLLRPRRPVWRPDIWQVLLREYMCSPHTARHHVQVRRPGSATGTSRNQQAAGLRRLPQTSTSAKRRAQPISSANDEGSAKRSRARSSEMTVRCSPWVEASGPVGLSPHQSLGSTYALHHCSP